MDQKKVAKYKEDHERSKGKYVYPLPVEVEEEEDDLPTKMKLLRKRKQVGRFGFIMYDRRLVVHLGQEYLLLITLKEMIFFMVFLIMLILLIRSQVTFYSNQLFNTMRIHLIKSNGFDKITTATQMWEFLEKVISEDLYYDYWYYPKYKVQSTTKEDRALSYTNRLLGVPLLRQLQVRNDSCPIHPRFQRTFLRCFGRFSKDNESKKPFGLGSGKAWTYTAPAFMDLSYYWGEIEFYPGGGFQQELALTKSASLKILHDLLKNLWLQRGTRAILFEFSTYNVNVNIFTIVRLVFEYPPTGGVVPSYSILNFKLLKYLYYADYFYFAAKLFMFVFLVYLLMETIFEIRMHRWGVFKMFWPYIDLITIGLGSIVMIADIFLLLLGEKQIKVVLANKNKFTNLYNVAHLQRLHDLALAIFIFFCLLKIFKYMNYSRRMAHLRDTLYQSKMEIFSFGFMFFIALSAFSILGYMLFGMTVRKMHTLSRTFLTLLNAILVTLDFSDLEQANRIWAPIFWLSYIFIITFVLLNMYIAIINHTYFNVKTKFQIQPEKKRLNWLVKRGLINILRKCRLNCILSLFSKREPPKGTFLKTKAEMATILKHVGYSEDRIQMFYERCGLHPTKPLTREEIQRLYNFVEGNIDPISKATKIPNNILTKGEAAVKSYNEQFARLDTVEDYIKKEIQDIKNLVARIDDMETRLLERKKIKH